jgi:hypothetical protein
MWLRDHKGFATEMGIVPIIRRFYHSMEWLQFYKSISQKRVCHRNKDGYNYIKVL